MWQGEKPTDGKGVRCLDLLRTEVSVENSETGMSLCQMQQEVARGWWYSPIRPVRQSLMSQFFLNRDSRRTMVDVVQDHTLRPPSSAPSSRTP